MPSALHVLVVDDSALVRQGLATLLGGLRGFRITTAADPLFALQKIARDRPDVILTDLEMPRMDGLAFVRKLMAEDPIPVVVCSALAGHYAEAAIHVLEAGAVDVIAKPPFGVREFLEETAARLAETLRAAAASRLRRRPGLPLPAVPRLSADAVLAAPERSSLRLTSDKVVTLGASTGGTEALREVLEAMPPDAPALLIVQHMPEGFTRAFAQRLNQSCRIEVKEAEDGDRVVAGRALIAPGNRHLMVRRSGAHYVAVVQDGPPVCRHRPSVDVLFRSAAREAGANAIGVLMTGMGDDGARGLLEMKQAGAATVAQDETSCVVFGMPKEAIALGAADEVLPLDRIAGRVQRLAARTLRPQI